MKATLSLILLSLTALAARNLKLDQLPAVVQSAVTAQTANAVVVGISKESEHGRILYEIETRVKGKVRDLMIDEAGRVVSVEEEVELASVPEAARKAIEKRAAGSTIKIVEKITEGSTVGYEATILRNGKISEFVVNADGSPRK